MLNASVNVTDWKVETDVKNFVKPKIDLMQFDSRISVDLFK